MKTVSKINTLEELVYLLDQGKYAEVLAQISELKIELAQISPFVFWSSEHYTRNCIKRTDEFELLLLCWEPGQASAVHSHNEQECWVKVVSGNFVETVFSIDEKTKEMTELKRIALSNAATSNMVDHLLYHSLANLSTQRAISLHLYIKPIINCEVYDAHTKTLTTYSTKYYSVGGKII